MKNAVSEITKIKIIKMKNIVKKVKKHYFQHNLCKIYSLIKLLDGVVSYIGRGIL
jgi:hypothetical protein